MKLLLISLLLLGSTVTHAANNYLFECQSKAFAAAKAVDELNFVSLDRSSVVVTDRKQKKSSAIVDVSFSDSSNRRYTVKMEKNRSASLIGDSILEEVGCSVASVDVN